MHVPDTQRLFFGLLLPQVLREELVAIQRRTLPPGAGRPVTPTNLHLTLAFLGETDATRRQCVEQAAQEVHAPVFNLVLDHLGWWVKPQVLWAAPSATPDAIKSLVKDLDRRLVHCGFKPERRPYQAHLTLARKVRKPLRLPPIAPIAWRIQDFHLFRSVSEPAGVRYEVLATWPLMPDSASSPE